MESNLLTSLRNAANELLSAEGIYSVLDYGWDDAETPSIEYKGLHIWSTNAPFEPDFNPWDRTAPPPNPTERDEVFHTAGEDFIGTMELARNSFGLTLYSWEHRKPLEVLDPEETFWEHHATTMIWVNIASDRIRDYFLMARFGVTAKEYKELHRKNGEYARPFRMHQSSEGKNAKQAAKELVPIAERLALFRKTRNQIVHAVASQEGKNAVMNVSLQRQEASRKPYIAQPPSTATPDWDVMQNTINTMQEEKQNELRKALKELKEWYLLLVRAGSMVFEFEYWKRINQ